MDKVELRACFKMVLVPLTVLALFTVFLILGRVQAQSQREESPQHPDHIFLIDTSYSMNRMREPVTRQLSNLLLSGINGRMQSNDTYAVWTFDTRLHAEFAIRPWSPHAAQMIAEEAARFIKSQRFEKQNRFDQVIPKTLEQISASTRGTVAILSDGDSKFSGTMFDAEVNSLFQRQGRDARRNKKIFLILFASQNHELTAWSGGFDASLLNLPIPPSPAPVSIHTNLAPRIAPKEPVLAPLAPKTPSSRPETNSINEVPRESDETKLNISMPPARLSDNTNHASVPSFNVPPQPVSPALQTDIPKTETNIKTTVEAPTTSAVEMNREADRLKSQILSPSKEAKPAPQPTPTITEPLRPTPIASEESSKAAPPRQEFMATANPASDHRITSSYFLIAGIILFGAAVGILMRYYRTRSRRGPSLISRSMDR